MNWLEALWKKLTAPPPSAARKVYTTSSPSSPPPAANPAAGSPPKTPATGIKTSQNFDPRSLDAAVANFTPRAQQALALARKEADRLNHNFVGTEHVLLGLITLGQGTAVTALMNMGINLENIRTEIVKHVGTGPDQKMTGHIPFTPRVKKVLALGIKEAKALNHTYTGTEHILLGLLREGDGVAAKVLHHCGIDIEQTRAAIFKVCEVSGGANDEPFRLAKAPPANLVAPSPSELTPRAQQVLEIADKEAKRLNLNCIGTEHALLGLIRLPPGGIATNILLKSGLDEKAIRPEIEALANRHPEATPFPVDYAAPMKEALAFASQEAKQLGHTYIGTEHLLLALLRQTAGGAAQIFKKLEVETDTVRRGILAQLDPAVTVASAPASGPVPNPMDRSELPRDHFTPRVRRAFTLARDQAEKLHQPFVETEHVLLGLIRMGQGVAASVLIKIGVNAGTVAARLDPPRPAKAATTNVEPPPFSALVNEVLTFADEEARALEHTYIGTEHILLGLLRQPHSGAGRIFAELSVDAEVLRQQVLLAFEVKNVEPKIETTGGATLQPSEKDTEMYAKKIHPAAVTAPPSKSIKPPREPVDATQRYDVYCVEQNQKTTIYRNVRFKSAKSLYPRHDHDQESDFVELEQPDGQTFFIAKSMITRFGPPGTKPEIENL